MLLLLFYCLHLAAECAVHALLFNVQTCKTRTETAFSQDQWTVYTTRYQVYTTHVLRCYSVE